MEYRNLGRSGLQVSAVGLGCNNFGMRIDLEQTKLVVRKAIECGITLFDTADIYGGRGKSEEYLGLALEGNVARRSLVPARHDPDDRLLDLLRRQAHGVVERAVRRALGADGGVATGESGFVHGTRGDVDSQGRLHPATSNALAQAGMRLESITPALNRLAVTPMAIHLWCAT